MAQVQRPALDFSVLISSASNLEGVWIGHSLDFDLITQGRTPAEAFRMVGEAIAMTIADDVAAGFDSHERRNTTPKSEWDKFRHCQAEGEKLHSFDAVGNVPSKGAMIAASVRFVFESVADEPKPDPLPAYIIESLKGDSHTSL